MPKHFGPRVIGKAAYAVEAAKVAASAHAFGRRVTGDIPVPVPDAPSLDELEEILGAGTALIHPLAAAELARAQPRRDAIERLLTAEQNRQDEPPDAALVERLTAALHSGKGADAGDGTDDYDAKTVAELEAIAAARQIDLTEYEGSGAGGRLLKDDLIGILQAHDATAGGAGS